MAGAAVTGQPPKGAWVPPVAHWPALYSSPTCTVAAPVPAGVLIATVAEELKRLRLRVSVAADGRSVQAKPSWPLVLSVVGMVAGAEGFTVPKVTISVASESAAGTELTVLARVGGASGLGQRVAGALNAVAWRLAQGGVVLTATPWERYSRFRKD